MKLLLLAALAAACWADTNQLDALIASDLNVNSRYTVESIDFSGQRPARLSSSVIEQMQRLIGQKLNLEAVDQLARTITSELRARSTAFHLARGGAPGHVRVFFDIDRRTTDFDVAIPTLSYHSREGWSGAGQVTITNGPNAFTFAGVSNGNDLVERYSGVKARYERMAPGTERVRLGFEFDDYREQYNNSSISSLGAGAYRSRRNFEPSATFVLAKPLTLTVGMSFESLDGSLRAAKTESANAVIETLRFHKPWAEAEAGKQVLDAGYSLRAATTILGSSTAYTRHAFTVRYAWVRERQSVELETLAGMISGRAPLFERFVLGNSATLRGWDKYELAPLGGNRVAYASVTYGYRRMRVFYDTGSVWDKGNKPALKQSAGAGVATGLGLFGKEALLIALAFPIRQGHVEPVFIAGMNF
jgi:hypothetical protein